MVIIIEDDKEKPIEEVKPKTRVEFEAYAKRLGAMIVANSVRNTGLSCNEIQVYWMNALLQKSINYGAFLDTLVREIAAPCKDMDIRKAASSLTAMANDKQRQAKEATKAKKKGKPQLAAAGKSAALDDSTSYRDVYDDFDDFM